MSTPQNSTCIAASSNEIERLAMLRVVDILRIESLKDRLPQLCKTDLDFVVAHIVTLQAAGIPADASLELERLESIVIDFGWRLAYCRYVEQELQGHRMPVRYDEWAGRQKCTTDGPDRA